MQGKVEYSKLRKKYKKLPDWEWVNKNFRLKFEDEGPVLDQVRASVVEKLDMMAHSIIEPIIGGGENYCCYYERGMLTPVEKEQMFEIYKALQSLLWKSNAIAVDFDEKDAADWLADVKGKFEDLGPALVKLCEKLSAGWGTYKKHEVETAYHG
jgi:hypothetical protein